MTRRVKIIKKREFASVALSANDKTFVVYIVALEEPTTMPIYPFCQAQVTALTSKETGIPAKYSNFSNIFFSDSMVELPEHTEINDHSIHCWILSNRPMA